MTILVSISDLGGVATVPAGAQVTVVADHDLELTWEGRVVGTVDLTSSPLVPACAYSLADGADGYTLTCTVSPVPASLLATLSSQKV